MKRYSFTLVLFFVTPLLFGCNRKAKYTITFNGNGGACESSNTMNVDGGTKFKDIAPIASKIGADFAGWTLDQEGNNPISKEYVIDKSITLYAQYSNINCTLKFETNSGQLIGPSTITCKYGDTFSSLNIPTILGHQKTYYQWTLNNGTYGINPEYRIEGDTTFTAKFSDNSLELEPVIDSTLLPYGSTSLNYHSYKSDANITVTSNNVSLVPAIDKEHSSIKLDVQPNLLSKQSNIVITVSDGIKTIDCPSININMPSNLRETGEAFDNALTKHLTEFKMPISGCTSVSSLGDFISDNLETRGVIDSLRGNWPTSDGKILYISDVIYNQKMALTMEDICNKPKYYYQNVKNFAYELRHSRLSKKKPYYLPIDYVNKLITVHNSEGLFFALEHGYRPIFDLNEVSQNEITKNAYLVYMKAREACVDALGNETTGPLMQIRQLYEWMISNTHYDYWVVSNECPIKYWSESSSYFPEGVFLNKGIAVCDGFAKSLSILTGIYRLPVIRAAGFTNDSGHAWNYYLNQTDKTWYLLCPTWGHTDINNTDVLSYKFSLSSYQSFLANNDYFYSYTYQTRYNYYISKGRSHSESDALAKSEAKRNQFVETLFLDFKRSSSYLYKNDEIYTDDKFSGNYNYKLDSNNAANELINAIKSLSFQSDFMIDLSINSDKKVINYLFTELLKDSTYQNVIEYNDFTGAHRTFIINVKK